MHRFAACVRAAVAAALVATPAAVDATQPRASGLVTKKEVVPPSNAEAPALLATLVQTHTDERVILDDTSPSTTRFSELLADRVTGEVKELDPRLVELLRSLVKDHPGARIELVSGYRSAKLNEMMRKKGRHVASHSQHSLGHAVDFRLVLPEHANEKGEPSARAVHPRELETRIRALGWEGGVGVYTLRTDWFVHADVGRNRRWSG